MGLPKAKTSIRMNSLLKTLAFTLIASQIVFGSDWMQNCNQKFAQFENTLLNDPVTASTWLLVLTLYIRQNEIPQNASIEDCKSVARKLREAISKVCNSPLGKLAQISILADRAVERRRNGVNEALVKIEIAIE